MCLKIIILITFLLISFIVAKEYPKCCDSFQYFNSTSNSENYTCVNYSEVKFQIVTEDVDFLSRNVTGLCTEITENGIALFEKTESDNLTAESESLNYFTKCCPYNFLYDSKRHRCVETDSTNKTFSFIKSPYIKIGLPECDIVNEHNNVPVDEIFKNNRLMISENFGYSENNFCIDMDENGKYVVKGCEDGLSICSEKRCIRKCCPDGQSFVNGRICKPTYIKGLDLSFTDRIQKPDDPLVVIHGFKCRLYIVKPTRYSFTVDDEGTFAYYDNTTEYDWNFPAEEMSYCIEHVTRKGADGFHFFGCLTEGDRTLKIVISRWAKVISCVCLVVTIAVYLSLPEMRNLFGKILISYCVSLFSLFCLLVYLQFRKKHSDKICYVCGFINIYLVFTLLSWLNIICFDVWWLLGSPKCRMTVKQKLKDTKRLLVYCFYGWCCPLIWTLIIYFLSQGRLIPRQYRPFVGLRRCYLEKIPGRSANYIFLIMPMTIMELVNAFLFIRTVMYCLKVKAEISRMRDVSVEKKNVFAVDTEKMALLLKLTVIMGVSYLFEVVSSFTDFNENTTARYVEVIWDTINCCQGIFIFIIFVFKKKIWQSLLAKFFRGSIRKISTISETGTTPINGSSRNSPE